MPKIYNNLRSINLSQFQKDFLVGTILGDGCLYKEYKTPKLIISHSTKQIDYFNYKINIFTPFIINTPKIYTSKTRNSTTIQASTVTHPDFLYYYNLFYNDKKYISSNLIDHITPLSLAIWIQDDGSLNSVNLRMATQSFTYNDHLLLQNILKIKFNLETKIKFCKYYYLTFDKENTIKISKLCKPFIINSMKYKFLL